MDWTIAYTSYFYSTYQLLCSCIRMFRVSVTDFGSSTAFWLFMKGIHIFIASSLPTARDERDRESQWGSDIPNLYFCFTKVIVPHYTRRNDHFARVWRCE